jgi:hypothetical protein
MTGMDEADIWKDTAESDRTGDRNTFAVGKPAVDGAGTPSDRGARAVVAVARKLAVLLHRLWVSGEVYEPLRNSQKAMRAMA